MCSAKLLAWLHAIGRQTPIDMLSRPWLVDHL